MRSPNCVSCELSCDLAGVKAGLDTALREAASPVAEARLGVEITEYDRGRYLIDEGLREMVGQRGFDDPDGAIREAGTSLAVTRAVTDAYSDLVEAQHAETTSPLLNEGRGQGAAIEDHLLRLPEWCSGPRRGFTLPRIGFIALGFGPSSRCRSPRAPLVRAVLADIRDRILPR